jgi:hypothetical protein
MANELFLSIFSFPLIVVGVGGVDQAPEVVMIGNYRTGLFWKLFMNCPEISTRFKNIGFSKPLFIEINKGFSVLPFVNMAKWHLLPNLHSQTIWPVHFFT